jgi:transcription elongation GreA/GreB family factor
MNDLKEKLYKLCVAYVSKRVNEAKQAVEDANEAGIEETKSSAGDKYETGREMMQQESDRNLTQLNEANKLMVSLNQINYNTTSSTANAGSLVFTDNGKFYIAISAGALKLDNETYFAVSAASPIGQKLMGLKTGDAFSLNGKNYKVESVY